MHTPPWYPWNGFPGLSNHLAYIITYFVLYFYIFKLQMFSSFCITFSALVSPFAHQSSLALSELPRLPKPKLFTSCITTPQKIVRQLLKSSRRPLTLHKNMPQKEKNPAFVLRKVNDVSIEERPLPKLESPYDVKVHVKATGYSMTVV